MNLNTPQFSDFSMTAFASLILTKAIRRETRFC